MVKQLTIDDIFEKELTNRQWKHYEFLKENVGTKFANEEEELKGELNDPATVNR